MSILVETAQVEQQGLVLVSDAKALTIQDDTGYQRAGAMLRAVKDYLRRVAEISEPVVQAALKAHRAAVAQRTQLEAPAKEAEGVLKRAMIGYTEEVERRRQEAQRKAEVLAEEARVVAAMEAEARGDGAAQEMVVPVVLAPVGAPAPPKAEGVSYREVWRAEVTDLAMLVKAVAQGQAPLRVLQPNLSALNELAKAMRGELVLPGVKAIAETVAAVR